MQYRWTSEFEIACRTGLPSGGTAAEHTETCNSIITALENAFRNDLSFVKPVQEELDIEFDIFNADNEINVGLMMSFLGSKKPALSKPKLKDLLSEAFGSKVALEKKLITQYKVEVTTTYDEATTPPGSPSQVILIEEDDDEEEGHN